MIDTFGSPELGLGHVYRSLALGRKIGQWADVFFRVNGFNGSESLLDLRGRRCFSDAADIADIINSQAIDALIIDRPNVVNNLDPRWRQQGCLVAALDYYGIEQDGLDVVINLNSNRAEGMNKQGSYFEGLQYAIIKDEVLKWRPSKPKVNAGIKKVLVTFGGSDPKENLTRAAALLDSVEDELEVTIVIGALADGPIDLAPSRHSFAVVKDPADMAERMDRADLGICNGGTTMMELLCLGKPVCVIPKTDDEAKFAALFEREQAVCLGDWRRPAGFRRLIDDHKRRLALAERGHRLIDGRGGERIRNIILNALRAGVY